MFGKKRCLVLFGFILLCLFMLASLSHALCPVEFDSKVDTSCSRPVGWSNTQIRACYDGMGEQQRIYGVPSENLPCDRVVWSECCENGTTIQLIFETTCDNEYDDDADDRIDCDDPDCYDDPACQDGGESGMATTVAVENPQMIQNYADYAVAFQADVSTSKHSGLDEVLVYFSHTSFDSIDACTDCANRVMTTTVQWPQSGPVRYTARVPCAKP